MTVLHDNLGNPIDAKNPLPVDVSTSDAIVPTDIQSHLQTTIQTHNAVSIPLSSGSTSLVYIDCDGVDRVAITMLNDASANSDIQFVWSNDGVAQHGIDAMGGNTSKWRTAEVPTKARYLKIYIGNLDSTLAHTISAWVYLKA